MCVNSFERSYFDHLLCEILGHICQGITLVHIPRSFDVGVARVWRRSGFAKWLWLESDACLALRSGCGSSLAHFWRCEVAVARVWRISGFVKWLWLESGTFLALRSGCG